MRIILSFMAFLYLSTSAWSQGEPTLVTDPSNPINDSTPMYLPFHIPFREDGDSDITWVMNSEEVLMRAGFNWRIPR